MKPKDIVRLANRIRDEWGSNPFDIARRLGIVVFDEWESNVPGFTAQTMKLGTLPSVISINKNYPPFAKELLCAHELGHALLHESALLNYFNDDNTITEAEANLFALALIGGRELEDEVIIPLEKMDGPTLKAIMDLNIYK